MVERVTTPVSLSIRGRLAFLVKDSALYGGAAAISKSFALITFPLLARHFSVADYGVLDYFMVLSGFMVIMFIFGQDSAVARYFYEHEDTNERRQLISQSLVFQLAGLFLLVPPLWLNADRLTGLLIEAPNSSRLFKIVLMQLPFLLLINFSQNLLKWTFARARFLTISLGFSVTQAMLLVIAVLFFNVGIEGVLLITFTTSTFFGVLGIFFIRRWLARPRGFSRLREMLPYAVPFGIICVLSSLSPTLERALTNQLLGVEELGFYAAGAKLAMLIGLSITAFQTAWGPFSLSLYKQADAAQTYNWVLKLFTILMCVIVLALSLVAKPMIQLLASDRYGGAVVVVFPLAMGLAIQATSWITEIGIGIAKRSYLNLYAYALALVVTLAGIMLLAPFFGLLGVGLGVMLGQTTRALISSWLAQRTYPLPWSYTPVIMVLSLTLIFGLVATWVDQYLGSVFSVLTLVVGLISVLGLGWSVLLNQLERRRILAFMRFRLTTSNRNI